MNCKVVETPDFNESMSFGKILKKKRRLLGMNQADFGEYIGDYYYQTISSWEIEATSPPFEEARRIIEFLGGEFKFVNHVNKENPYKR